MNQTNQILLANLRLNYGSWQKYQEAIAQLPERAKQCAQMPPNEFITAPVRVYGKIRQEEFYGFKPPDEVLEAFRDGAVYVPKVVAVEAVVERAIAPTVIAEQLEVA